MHFANLLNSQEYIITHSWHKFEKNYMRKVLNIWILHYFDVTRTLVAATGLERTHHVYEVSGVVYNAVLGMVDIQRGSNSYYKLQILESDAKSQ